MGILKRKKLLNIRKKFNNNYILSYLNKTKKFLKDI